ARVMPRNSPAGPRRDPDRRVSRTRPASGRRARRRARATRTRLSSIEYRFLDRSRARAVVRSTMPSLLRTAIIWAWLGILLPRCSKALYFWGHYGERIYASYVSPGTTSLEAQAAELERDYEKARAERKR